MVETVARCAARVSVMDKMRKEFGKDWIRHHSRAHLDCVIGRWFLLQTQDPVDVAGGEDTIIRYSGWHHILNKHMPISRLAPRPSAETDKELDMMRQSLYTLSKRACSELAAIHEAESQSRSRQLLAFDPPPSYLCPEYYSQELRSLSFVRAQLKHLIAFHSLWFDDPRAVDTIPSISLMIPHHPD